MTEISARVADLINFSSNQKPIEFAAAFKEILQDKVAAAIDTRKMEIAGRMFNAPEAEDDEEDQETKTDSESEVEAEEQEDGETT